MANLERIILKHSTEEALQTFISALGDTGVPGGSIEPGEVVVRRGDQYAELWTLDKNEQPVQISVDIGGTIAPWDPVQLGQASLDLLSDVDYDDGILGTLGLAQAGHVLTWDGTKWVVRQQLAAAEFEGLLPSLNDVGDVNYAFYATESNPKFTPDIGDVLIWDYNYTQQKYEWAPVALALNNLQNVSTFSGVVNLSRNVYSRLQFGLTNGGTQQAGLFGSGGEVGISIGNQVFRLTTVGARLTVRDGLEINTSTAGYRPGIWWSEENLPSWPLPNDRYAVTLRHVRSDWNTHNLGELANVEDTGILNGYVLVWNADQQRYEPGVGPAPDLTAASINELQDVDTSTKSRGLPLAWDPALLSWTPQSILLNDLKWDYYSFFYSSLDPNNYTTRCKDCTAANLGRITVVGNVPYVCLQTRSTSQRNNGNDRYGWVRLLHDGYNRTANNLTYPPDENRPAVPYRGRTDPLATVAYEGSIGSLSNVSTAGVFANSTLVYDPGTLSFVVGYPALDLSGYSIGQLGDVDVSGAGAGYGLIWSGSTWEAKTLDQRFRLDDMQDVQFGALGVANDKLVAAYQLIANPQLPAYQAGDDVSSILAVSAAKGQANLGTTRAFSSPNNHFYATARYWGVESNWTLAQKLDNYVRWPHEPSWQTIDGDGAIELFFYCPVLLQTRTLFRKVASAGSGGYILQLKQNGGLEWTVTAPNNQGGFSLSSPINSVSLNNWHHVAVTKSGLFHRLYLDGNLISQTTSNATYTGDGFFLLGRNDLDDNNTLTHHFWAGYIQDLRVYRGRPVFTGSTYTIPYSIGAEVLDTTPQAGDFLSYDGTKWTNVNGVTADISANSITELADVDTSTINPGTGDALVWTGNAWEPGIPGIGATWGLNDFTDVSTNYSSGTPYVRLDQADLLTFSALSQTPNDLPYLYSQQGSSMRLAHFDYTYTCDPYTPGHNGPYVQSQTTYFRASVTGQADIRAVRVTIQNVFSDCSIVGFIYHEDTLHYAACPDRGLSNNLGGDIPGVPDETYIPCWGVLEDHFYQLLPYGQLKHLGDVSETAPTLGQALAWNGTQWAPSSSIAADISNNSINDLADVNTASAASGQVLTWNGSLWVPSTVLPSFFAFDDVDPWGLTSTSPINSGYTLNGLSPVSGVSAANSNTLVDFGVADGRGIAFNTRLDSGQIRRAFVFGGTGTHSPTIITSGMQGTTGSWIEVGTTNIRVADNGASTNGTSGFSLAGRWRFRYEDTSLDWSSFTNDQVPNKRGIITHVAAGLANLDLSPYSVNALADVNTTGAALGYALIYDGTQWVPSASVAADISASSIGGLADVDKQANTDASTNDGYLTFDVGRFITSRPRQTGGGIELLSSNSTGVYGWSSSYAGSPQIRNSTGPSSITLRPNQVDVTAGYGIVMSVSPSLTDSTLPTWLQTRQEIARGQTDYLALFLLSCDNLLDRAYGWPLQVSMTTLPNPVYESAFSGSYSLRFSKANKDRIQWLSADSSPTAWAADLLWSFEFMIRVDSTSSGDSLNEYIICPAGGGASRYSTGLHVYLIGNARNQIGVSIGTKDSQSVGSHQATGSFSFNTWTHVYVAHEGGGAVRLYINGLLAGSFSQNSAWTMTGGLSIGGRDQAVTTQGYGYLSAQLDDLRVTRGWVPYAVNAGSVPVPVEPLNVNGNRFVFGKLSMLSDVNTVATTPIQGSVLTYDAVAGYWKPGTGPAADISQSSINQLTDVTTTNSVPDQDDILAWSAANADWRRTKVDGNGGVRPLMARTVTPGVVPSAGSLYAGELFLNMADKKLYALDATGTAFSFAQGDVLSLVTVVTGGTY